MKPADLKRALLERHPESRLTPLPREKVDALRARHPGVPEDYVQFLTEIGHGRVGAPRLSVYSGPIEPRDIYDPPTAEALAGVWLVGDDFTGFCVGYDTRSGWRLCGVDDDGTFDPMEDVGPFSAFVVDWCL